MSREYATCAFSGKLHHARHWFVLAAQQLLDDEYKLRRERGICYNLDGCINYHIEEVSGSFLDGYEIVKALCGGDSYAVFGHVHEGRWGDPDSDGDVFRRQWLSARIAEARCMTDAEWIRHLRAGGAE